MSSGRVTVVTGAGSGIGRSLCELLIARRERVVALDLPSADLGWLPETNAVAVVGDVTDESANRAAVCAARDHFGRLDGVALNAGMSASGDLVTADLAVFDRSIAVNLRAVVLGLRAAVPLLTVSGGGSVVVTASVTALGGEPGRWPYAAAKAGAVNLVRSAAIDLARHAIRVNAVCPGPVETGMTARIARDAPDRYEALRRMVPLQRWAQPLEVAEVIGFLLSPAASYITGVALPVDGGAAAGSGQTVPPLIDP